jgi:hypothetical protein
MNKEDKRNKILESQGIRMVRMEREIKPVSRLVDPLSVPRERSTNVEKERVLPKPELIRKEVPVPDSKEVEKAPIPEIMKVKKGKSYKKLILVLLAAALLLYGGYIIQKKFNISDLLDWRTSSSEKLIRDVGKLVDLPANETPSIMTVTDLGPLAGQTFFSNAQIGDKVLIYSQSKRAILYRPDEKRIIVSASISE